MTPELLQAFKDQVKLIITTGNTFIDQMKTLSEGYGEHLDELDELIETDESLKKLYREYRELVENMHPYI